MRVRPHRTLGCIGAAAAALMMVGCAAAVVDPLQSKPTIARQVEPLAPIPSTSPSPTPLVDDPTAQGANPTAGSRPLEDAELLVVVDERLQVPEYRRASFGSGWIDTDANGCSTRNDVLARDLVAVVWMDERSCTVASGVLHDRYTGDVIVFQHDAVAEPENPGSQGVQIDHIVSLSAAHAGGAWRWTEMERVLFSNDPHTLIAVDGPTNAAKGDRGPGTWMPEDPGYWCEYATAYTQIATTYELAVSGEDKQMLIDVLTACH